MTESVSCIKDTREPKLPNGVVQRVSKTGELSMSGLLTVD